MWNYSVDTFLRVQHATDDKLSRLLNRAGGGNYSRYDNSVSMVVSGCPGVLEVWIPHCCNAKTVYMQQMHVVKR